MKIRNGFVSNSSSSSFIIYPDIYKLDLGRSSSSYYELFRASEYTWWMIVTYGGDGQKDGLVLQIPIQKGQTDLDIIVERQQGEHTDFLTSQVKVIGVICTK